MTLAAHTQVRAQDPAAVVAVLTPATAATVVDIHRTAAADRRPMVAVEVHRLTAAEAAIAIRNQAPAPTASAAPGFCRRKTEKSDGQPTGALSALKE